MTAVKNRETQLDVIRGLAIFLAMGWHLNGSTMDYAISNIWLFPGRSIGWAGVDLFFVLSGFLVGGNVLREAAKTGRFDYKTFLIKRAFRLWPVLYVYLLAQMFFTSRPWGSFLPQIILHVQNFFETPLNHLWSLAVEEQFYLLLGLGLPVLIKFGMRPRHYVMGLVGLIIATWLLRLIAAFASVDPHAIQIQTQYRLDGIAIGVLLALLAQRYPQVYAAMAVRRGLNAVLAISLFVSLVWLSGDVMKPAVGYTVAAIGSGLAILAFHKAPGTFWASSAANAVAFLGICSYPLYIWHNGVGNQLTPWLASKLGVASPDLVVVGKYAASIAFAVLMTFCVERPFLRLRDRIVKDNRTQPEGVTA